MLIPEYDQSSTLLEVSGQNVMPRQMKSLSFSFVSFLTYVALCCCCFCCIGMMKKAVKQFLTEIEVNFYFCRNYEVERSSQE